MAASCSTSPATERRKDDGRAGGHHQRRIPERNAECLFDVDVPEPSPPYQTHYAVTADGQRFLVNTLIDQPSRPGLTVMLN
jgi:hypothetical protein